MFLFLTLIWFVFTVYVPNIYVWKFHFSLSYINPHQKLLDTINVDLIKKIGYFLGEHAQLDIKNVSGVRITLSDAISTIANQLASRSLFSSTDTLVKKQLGVSSKHTTYNTYAITWTEPMRFQFMEFAESEITALHIHIIIYYHIQQIIRRFFQMMISSL